MKRYIPLLGFLAAVMAVQLMGSAATFTSVSGWYQTLVKPFHSPPDWVFGPVWTVLYLMIAYSGFRVWEKLDQASVTDRFLSPAMHWYGVQLVLNLLWSIFFFGMENPMLALIDILLLMAAIIICFKEFRAIDDLASKLLLPYLMWVCYATTLNLGIVLLN